jgi:hypothetical protein
MIKATFLGVAIAVAALAALLALRARRRRATTR